MRRVRRLGRAVVSVVFVPTNRGRALALCVLTTCTIVVCTVAFRNVPVEAAPRSILLELQDVARPKMRVEVLELALAVRALLAALWSFCWRLRDLRSIVRGTIDDHH
jgi:hypothetical protein